MIVRPLIDYKIYCVTCGDEKKRDNISKWSNDTVTFVNGVNESTLKLKRFEGGPHSWGITIDRALTDMHNDFSPFVIIEDDCSLSCKIDRSIDVPDSADAVYVGISVCSARPNDHASGCDIVAFDVKSNNDVMRVHNMLSTHGIMIMSPAYAAALRATMVEAAVRCSTGENIVWDMLTARLQSSYEVYATKQPFVYQDSKYHGQEGPTKIEMKNHRQFHNEAERISYRNTKQCNAIKFVTDR